MVKYKNNINMKIEKDWKMKSKEYLIEIQKFLDKVDNIENETLRKEIIIQMLRCDEELTKIAEGKFQEYYEQGKKC